MKKLETLKKEIARLEAEKKLEAKLKEIAKNEATDLFESFEKREALALMQFAELEKALKVKDKYELVLDINYAESRAKDIDLTRMSLLNNKQKRAIHLYQHTNTFDICFSCSKATREKVNAIKELNKSIKEHYNATITDTTVFKRIHFDELVNACKFALIILESSFDELVDYVAKQSEAEQSKAE